MDYFYKSRHISVFLIQFDLKQMTTKQFYTQLRFVTCDL